MKIIYSKHYDITFCGLERIHPFDSRKYSRAMAVLRSQARELLAPALASGDRMASLEELSLVHTAEYLGEMRKTGAIATALEMPPLRYLPGWLLRWKVLRPMRWAARGSVVAAEAALQEGVAVNLSGGYHHAKPFAGEGFCIYSDIALVVRQLRKEGKLKGRVAYIDLDAHQGNGVCYQFQNDSDVFLFDMYHSGIYPFGDPEAVSRIDCPIPLPSGCHGNLYLRKLRAQLPGFLDSISRAGEVDIAIYNAGTDVFEGDPLGDMALSVEDVLVRDLYVIAQLRDRDIPVVMLLSGGYSPLSYRLVANTVLELLNRY